MLGLSAGVSFAIFAFLAVVAILWFLMPFAVFGIKDRLDTVIREQQDSQAQVNQLMAILKQGNVQLIDELKEANKNSKASALFLKASLNDLRKQ